MKNGEVIEERFTVLRMLHEEGLANVQARHEEMAATVRTRVAELGLSLQCPALRAFSPTLTAIALPPTVAPKTVRDRLKASGILTAAGLGPFQGSAFRIGHMGDIRMTYIARTLAALTDALSPAR